MEARVPEGQEVSPGVDTAEREIDAAAETDLTRDLEKQEEAKLSMRYPAAVKPMAGHSAFLQKRLAKGQKYFDSGDYQMAKQTGKNNFPGKPRMMPPILTVAPEIQSTGESMAVRKTSLVQPPSKLANS